MSELEGQPNLSQFAEAVIDAASEEIRVAIPGVFVDVSNDLRSGSVRPSVSRFNSSPDPTVPDVPILYPGGSGASISWTVSPGDSCLLVFQDRDMDSWVGSGGRSTHTASDPRTHDITDAVAIPVAIPSGARADGTVRINAGTGGRIAIGNSSAELLSILTDIVDAFLTPGTIGANAVPGSPVLIDPGLSAALVLLKAKLALIKGSL